MGTKQLRSCPAQIAALASSRLRACFSATEPSPESKAAIDRIGCTPSTKILVLSEDSCRIRSSRADSSRCQTRADRRVTASVVPRLTTTAS